MCSFRRVGVHVRARKIQQRHLQKCKITSSMSKTLRKSAVAQGAYLSSLLDSFAVDILTVGFHQTIPRQNPAVAC
jgi:hypothetical protein